MLDAKSLAYLGRTCRELHIRVIADKRWEELLSKNFSMRYKTIYCTLADHTFYKIYCVEAMFAILEKRDKQITWFDRACEKCININGNICLWFTVTMPMIKTVAVILKASKTGNLLQAINTIL
jgi:hypothetical protein